MPLPPHPGDLVPLEHHDCVRRLQDAPWVRIGFTDAEGHPQVFPVSHLVYDHAVVFRTSPGSLLGVAAEGREVAVEVDGGEVADRIGWSVLARGATSLITDEAELERLHSLPFEPWAVPGDKTYWVRVEIESLTGRRIVRHS